MTAAAAPARAADGRGVRPAGPRLAWIVWRQHRGALGWVVALLGGCALGLGYTGLRMQAAYQDLAHHGCGIGPGAPLISRCGHLQDALYHAGYPLTGNVSLVVICLAVFPALIGVFAGAPLIAREIESGTYRFAWTQAASRTRWVIAKLALPAAVLAALAAAFGWLLSWWLQMVDRLPAVEGSLWQHGQFGLTAVTLTGWVLLAFALGVFTGAAIRRTVPAMGVTAAAMAALAGIEFGKLNGLLAGLHPVTSRTHLAFGANWTDAANSVPLTPGGGLVATPPGSWPLNIWFTSPRGGVINLESPSLYPLWSRKEPSQPSWIAAHHLSIWASYQPDGRFWALQAVEAGGCLLLALLLAAATVWLVRRRAG